VKIAVVAHDAGASELILAYIQQHRSQADWVLCAKKASPFEKLAHKKGFKTQIDLEIQAYDALFFGTGWKEHVERPYVIEAKKRGVPSFVFLDHWSAYRERFSYPDKHWRDKLPDFTVVSDKKAFALAQEYDFPHLLLVDNFYLQNQLSILRTLQTAETDNLLFLSEPTDKVALSTYGDSNYWGFTQDSALEEILKNFEKFNCSGLHIRLHPSEKGHHYNKVLNKFPHIKSQVYPSDFYPIEKDLLRSKLVIGFDTMALYTAALLGKPVISYLPSQNREFSLPLPSSHQLRSLNGLKPEHLQPISLELHSGGIEFAVIEQSIKEFRK